MKLYLIIVFYSLSFGYCIAQNKQFLIFEKKSNDNVIRVKMPTNCWIVTKSGKVYSGDIINQKDSVLQLRYYNFDTTKLTEVSNNKSLSNKTRKKLIDSIIKSDSTFVSLDYNFIEKINIGKADIKGIKSKLSFIGGGILFIATAGLFLGTIINTAEDDKRSVGDILAILSYPASFFLWLTTARKNISPDKWDLIIVN